MIEERSVKDLPFSFGDEHYDKLISCSILSFINHFATDLVTNFPVHLVQE